MKLTIDYMLNKGNKQFPCSARTEVQGETFYGVGENWAEAEASLIENVKEFYSLPIPEPKSLEVVLPNEEQTEPLPSLYDYR